jgi:hypothetical protein
MAKQVRIGTLVSKKQTIGKMSLLKILTDFYHKIQSPAKFYDGSRREYIPDTDSVEDLEPVSESLVKEDLFEELKRELRQAGSLIDLMGTVDYGNCHNATDVVIDGKVLIEKAPAPLLIWLEKNLLDLITILKTLPVLESGKRWERDTLSGYWKSGPHETKRTKKVVKPLILAEATTEHPAQVREISSDERIGLWIDNLYSSRITAVHKKQLITRAENLLEAVIAAKEEANSHLVEMRYPGTAVINYLFE